MKDNLARYKVPREIVFLDELPRNATGKVLKRELAELRRRAARARDGHGASGTMTGLAIGGPAPDFTLRDQFGQDVTLSSYRGKKAVALVFYPFAFSGVCTGEMAGIRDRLADFLTFDTELLAISLRPGLRAARLRRPRRAQLPAALRLLAARRGGRPTACSTSRGAPAPVVVRHRQGRDRPLGGPQRRPEGRDLDEHLRQLRADCCGTAADRRPTVWTS